MRRIASSNWQAQWDKTVAAAKKEGRLNFYVGRYGSEKLLDEFRKEFPEIKIISTNGAGNSLGTRIVAEARAGQYGRGSLQRRGGDQLRVSLQRQGARFDQVGVDPAGSARRVQVVWRQAPLQRPGTAACVHLHRQSDFGESLFQYQPGQSQRIQILLGSGPAQVERQIRLARAHRHRHRTVAAVFLLQSRSRAGISCASCSSISSRSIRKTAGR